MEEAARGQMVLPNFLLIGAAKAGTTSLWSYLAQHPEVYLPENKEPNYFAFADAQPNCVGPAPAHVIHELLLKFSVTTWPEYLALFQGRTDQKAVGEASVRYLYVPEAAARIHERLPEVRLIAVLREPVSRLYSHYWMNRQFQLEDLELEDAIAAEPIAPDVATEACTKTDGSSQYAVHEYPGKSLADLARVSAVRLGTFPSVDGHAYAGVQTVVTLRDVNSVGGTRLLHGRGGVNLR